MTGFFSLAMDFLVLCLLGATIFYSIRLSVSLKVFRESRDALGDLLEDLSNNITQAEEAILALKNAARDSGRDLQDTINKAKSLSEELQFISEAGNNLASRLERLAGQGREAAVSGPVPSAKPVSPFRSESRPESRPEPPRPQASAPVPPMGFAIRDRDFDRGEADVKLEDPFSGDDEDWQAPAGLQSKAERELFEALRKNKKGKTGRAT